jgi:nicotinate-nucleotide--dimethylbenzimidazole phosphoribosyltransferase
MNLLSTTLKSIQPLDKNAMRQATLKIDNLSKPIGSLGALEEIAAKMAGIKGSMAYKKHKKNIIIMCSDNGVVEEGVSACPQSVTKSVTDNFSEGITGVCVLAKYYGSDMTVVDVGINADMENQNIIHRKIAYGTKNMAKEPAMTREQAIKAIEIGIEIVDDLVKEGYELFGTGEMGIGNTSTSAAVISVLTGLSIDIVVGKGAGLNEEQYENKKSVIKRALEVNNLYKEDVIDVMSKVGGFDIAGLCGCFLGAAKNKLPIVIDGFISSAAALCAYRLNPLCKEYIFASHLSAEPGAIHVMEEMGLQPMINLKMRLGEGSGCPMAFDIIEAALYSMENMGTFEDANIKKDTYIDIRKC